MQVYWGVLDARALDQIPGRLRRARNDMKYDIHPDFSKLNFVPPLSPVALRLASPVMKAVLRAVRVPKGICAKRYSVAGYRGMNVPVEVFFPQDNDGMLPALLYLHGGAFCFRAAPYHKKLAMRYAREARCMVFFPDYHLLPGFPYPAAREDAICAFDWMFAHANSLGIDACRIAVGGDSAGAILASAICNHAAEKLCFQMLLYPALDVRMETDSMRQYTDTPLWNSVLNKKLWSMYLRGTPEEQWEAASPMHLPLPDRIPATYIETAEFDCLHDEGVAYAARLAEAGARVTLNETKGTIHGYDFALDSAVTEKSVSRRLEMLNLAFRAGNCAALS